MLPGQLGIGVYSPLLDATGNSVRGVRLCRSLSRQLGLHFLTVTRESRSTIRAVYQADGNGWVYEIHGDLLFAGSEQVIRTVSRESGQFEGAIVDVCRLDNLNDPARELLASMGSALREAGKAGFLVDPDSAVIRTHHQFDPMVFTNVDDALQAARCWRQDQSDLNRQR